MMPADPELLASLVDKPQLTKWKVLNKTKKQFATMETQIRELENESDSDSDITSSDETGVTFYSWNIATTKQWDLN